MYVVLKGRNQHKAVSTKKEDAYEGYGKKKSEIQIQICILLCDLDCNLTSPSVIFLYKITG